MGIIPSCIAPCFDFEIIWKLLTRCNLPPFLAMSGKDRNASPEKILLAWCKMPSRLALHFWFDIWLVSKYKLINENENWEIELVVHETVCLIWSLVWREDSVRKWRMRAWNMRTRRAQNTLIGGALSCREKRSNKRNETNKRNEEILKRNENHANKRNETKKRNERIIV